MAGWKIYECCKCGYEYDEKREKEEFDYKNFECPKCGRSARYFDEVVEDEE